MKILEQNQNELGKNLNQKLLFKFNSVTYYYIEEKQKQKNPKK